MKHEYPKWLYHPTLPARIVKDQEEHAAMPLGWYKSPADFPKDGEASAATVAPSVPVSAPAASAPQDPPPAPPVEDPQPGASEAAAEKAEQSEAELLYKANVATIVGKLKGSSKAALEHLQILEAANPTGARKGVMKAIEAELAALATT